MLAHTLERELETRKANSTGILNELVEENKILRLQRDDYRARMEDARIRLESLSKSVTPSVLSIRAIADSLRP